MCEVSPDYFQLRVALNLCLLLQQPGHVDVVALLDQQHLLSLFQNYLFQSGCSMFAFNSAICGKAKPLITSKSIGQASKGP